MSDALDPVFKCKLEIIARKLGIGSRKRFVYFCVRDYCLRNKHVVPSMKEVEEEMKRKESLKNPKQLPPSNLQDE